MICPLVVGLLVVSAGAACNIPRAKLLFLFAEYFVTLPILVYLGWKQRGMARPGSSWEHETRSSRRLALAATVGYVLVLVPLAYTLRLGIYQSDESAYLFQARCFAAGELYMEQPRSVRQASLVSFDQHVLAGGKWYGKYPFGWPAVLSIGTLAGVEWLVNPLLGLCLLGVTYLIGTKLIPPNQRASAVCLLALSPFFVLNCLGFMSHILCGLLLAGACFAYLSARDSKQPVAWYLGMLVCVALGALVRPFTAACVGIVPVAAAGWQIRRQSKARLWFLFGAALLGLASAGCSAWVNHQLTGSYLRSPYAVYAGTSTPPEISLRIGDIVQNLIKVTPVRLADTVATSFPFVFPLAIYGLFRRRRTFPWGLAAVFIAVVAGYLLQLYDSDSFVGERYYLEGFFAVAILAAVGWSELAGDCRWPRWFRLGLGGALCLIALADTAMCANWVMRLRWANRQIAEAAARPPVLSAVVVLLPSRDFRPKTYNLNRPGGRALYTSGAGMIRTSQRCVTLTYDETAKAARWGPCGADTSGVPAFRGRR